MQNVLEFFLRIGRKKRYQKGNILFFEGEKAELFFILLSGEVRVYKTLAAGKELSIHHFTPISFIAEMPAFEGLNYPASAICEKESEVLELDFKQFKALCQEDSKIALMLISSLFKKIQILEKELGTQSLDLRQKFLYFLLENEAKLSSLTQKQVAQKLNSRAESLSRLIKELKNKALIDTHKGKIKIINKNELFKLL
ncbi:Crp/Fnr family transcriptional regulator [Campylobacter sp. MIT 12-5580]|uniref:Crp/Fnr family transcriptional regulator n=1 Tax=Campylobacter sp. MIT 12-5580 TaxID=2040651 RepID=UPI0010F9F8DD|nr:Crp/Fnr family transcriptional regulator [Campylobacter sp. MIT 12-5580]TKX28624.1 Crp/Fnr family transcriptional regulator [Campylobacter sp. MIT 12-5580]